MARGEFRFPTVQVRGKIGGLVFVPGTGGRMTVRTAHRGPTRRTAGQEAGAARFRPVAQAWNRITREEAALWRAYGARLGARPDGTAVQPNNAFTALATKLLQIDPFVTLPRLPPTDAFLGDGVRVRVLASEAGLRYVSTGANAEAVLTELLVQPLRSRLRTPGTDRYRAAAFVAFGPDGLARDVALPPGPWAAAVRFVRADTGQETRLLELGVFEVEG